MDAMCGGEAVARSIDGLMRQVRACFNDMKAIADTLHADLGVNASTRALIECLDEEGAETVAHIARAKNVSRQHIQQLVDALVDGGLVRLIDNPAHKRSPLIELTATGRSVRQEIRLREARLVATVGNGLAAEDLDRAGAVLAEFRRRLNAGVNP